MVHHLVTNSAERKLITAGALTGVISVNLERNVDSERCSYCDSPAHGLVNCEKLDKKDKETSAFNKKGRSGRT